MSKKTKKEKGVKKLPGFFVLCSRTWQELSTFWRPLAGVTAIYGLLYFVLVQGLNISYSYQDIADSVSLELGDSPSWFAKSTLTISNILVNNSQSSSTAIVQFLLFIIATLAFIWTLRQLRNLKHIKMRDAYFDGNSRIIPATIVVILLMLTFIPAAIGAALLSVAQLGNQVELVVGVAAAITLLFVSFFWFIAWLPAVYIVSLPKGTPISSIRSATKLTKKRRFWMLRNTALYVIACLVILFAIMLLFVTVLPAASIVAAFVSGFVLFAVVQTFIFIVYRGLIDEL